MVNGAPDWSPTMSRTVELMESQTPAAPSTDHTINTETMVTTPRAMESRNAVFITDHGSIRVNRRRARRGGRLALAARAARVGWRGAGGGAGSRDCSCCGAGVGAGTGDACAGATGAAVAGACWTAGRTAVCSDAVL